jgi:hypothetical protein
VVDGELARLRRQWRHGKKHLLNSISKACCPQMP